MLSLGPEDLNTGDKSGLNMLLPSEVCESFSFKENVTDDDMKDITAAIVRLQLKLGKHLRTKSGIMKLQLKVMDTNPKTFSNTFDAGRQIPLTIY